MDERSATTPPAPQSLDAITRDFATVVKKSTYTSKLDEEYVSIVALTKWLCDNRKAFNRLASSGILDQPASPVTKETAEQSVRICCLSLYLQFHVHQGLIKHFLLFGDDEHLYTHIDQLAAYLKEHQPSHSEQLAAAVRQHHRKFYPVVFKLKETKTWDEEDALPITEMVLKGKGGTASIHRILVREEFVHPDLQKAVPQACTIEPGVGKCYRFALKSFKNYKHNRYAEERDAYLALGEQKGIVKYLGCFRKKRRVRRPAPAGGPQQYEIKKTDNILLEWAEMDLVKYFKQNDPPFLPREILRFWKRIFELAEAVRSIHSIKTENGSFRGIHADIKPANILIVQEEIKLADLGYAKFKREGDENDAEFSEPGGTKSYSAPEQFYRKPVDTRIDIWSLGIVLSIAATWVAKGQSGISDFREVRLDAQRKISADENSSVRDPPDAFFTKGLVLPVIREWHNVIRGALRRHDTITSQILDVIDNHMLRADPQDRVYATELCDRLAEIYRVGESNLPGEPSSQILEALRHANEKATPSEDTSFPTPAPLVEPDPDPRHADMNMPVRPTAARPRLHGYANEGPDANLPHAGHPSQLQQPHPSPQMPPASQVPQSPQSPQSPRSSPMSQLPAGPQSPTRFNLPQQSYAAAHANLSRQSFIRVPSLIRKPKKDPNLQEYFNGRDIVFLIDNSETMQQHWDNAEGLMHLFLDKLRGQDKDGMDMFFTFGGRAVEHSKAARDFISLMRKAAVKTGGSGKGIPDMENSLRKVFQKHEERLRRDSTSTDLVVYILTDGSWVYKHRDQVERCIVNFISSVQKRRRNKRPVAIQFIQFGNDPITTQYLTHLDDDLHEDEKNGIE